MRRLRWRGPGDRLLVRTHPWSKGAAARVPPPLPPFPPFAFLSRRVDEKTSAHLQAQGVEFLQFSFRWVNCLLLRELPFHLGVRLWDTYLAEGWVQGGAGLAGIAGTESGDGTDRGFACRDTANLCKRYLR